MLLALDIATKTGWRTKTASGAWDLSPKRDESKGMRLIRFKSKLVEICNLEAIKVIAYERPGGIHKASMMVQSELHGILKCYCEENNIDYIAFSSKEIKKYATGNGNASKQMMVEEAEKRKGDKVEDDNEADAYLIYDYYYENYMK